MIAKHSEKLDLAILCTHKFNKPLSEDFLNIFGTAMRNMGPARSRTYLTDIDRLLCAVDTILLSPGLPPKTIVDYHQIKRNLHLCKYRIPMYKKVI